jgi:hypothetical protein
MSEPSFKELDMIYEHLTLINGPDVVVVLIGNSMRPVLRTLCNDVINSAECDKKDRKVTTEQGRAKALQFRECPFLEASGS